MGEAELVAELRERLRAAETKLEQMQHDLFGNGQPGLIREIRTDIANFRDDLAKVNRTIIMCVAVLVTAIIAAGGGSLSLKGILDLITHAVKSGP